MNDTTQYFYIILALIGLFFIWSIIIFRYYLKLSKESAELGSHDKQQEYQIKELVKKNGHEQHQIDELKNKVVNLQGKIIELQTRIISCEQSNGKDNKTHTAPATGTPPIPPIMPNYPRTQPEKPEKQLKQNHNEALKKALEERRRKIEGEE